MPLRVAIIGAGPAGLAAAAMLLQPDNALFDEVHVRPHNLSTPALHTQPLQAKTATNHGTSKVVQRHSLTHYSRAATSCPLVSLRAAGL